MQSLLLLPPLNVGDHYNMFTAPASDCHSRWIPGISLTTINGYSPVSYLDFDNKSVFRFVIVPGTNICYIEYFTRDPNNRAKHGFYRVRVLQRIKTGIRLITLPCKQPLSKRPFKIEYEYVACTFYSGVLPAVPLPSPLCKIVSSCAQKSRGWYRYTS